MRSFILSLDKVVTETVKYGIPYFCYLWKNKQRKHPHLLFIEGNFLRQLKFEKDTRSRMKAFMVDPIEDLPLGTIYLLLIDALDLYKSGETKIN
nr:DUF1801 domain-containing protein [Algoriphagus lutimaris]